MAENIVVRFYNSGSPETGLSPTLTARNLSNDVLLNAVSMTEVGNGWYSYNWTDYDKTVTTLFEADGGATLSDTDRYVEGINKLDSYPNKEDWKGTQQVVIDRRTLRKKLRDTPVEWNTKEGTFGEVLGKKLNIDLVDQVKGEIGNVIDVINNIKFPSIDIPEFDIPQWLSIQDIHEALDSYENKELYRETSVDINIINTIASNVEQINNAMLPIVDRLGDDSSMDEIRQMLTEVPSIIRENNQQSVKLWEILSVYSNLEKKLQNIDKSKDIMQMILWLKLSLQSFMSKK